MIKTIKLEAKSRNKEEKAKKTRADGFIPAVLYGAGGETQNLKIVRRDFVRLYSHISEANLINLAIDGKEGIKTLIKDTQKDPVRDSVEHIDFYRVDMKKKIEVEIPFNFIGETKAVKELGGTLVKNMESINVKCLPGNLIEKIDIDLSSLNTFNDYVRVKDVNLSSDFEIINHPDDVIVHVMAPNVEEEEEEKEGEGEDGKEEKEEEKKEGEGEEKKEEK